DCVQVDGARDVDLRPYEVAIAHLRVGPLAGGDDRIAADDAVGDLSRRLRARERVFGSERRVDERPQLGGRVASDVELFNHGDVGGEPAKNVDAGLLVRLIVTGRQVAGDEAQ